MAADLHTTPTSNLRVQLCGDAHLSNFGAYASPERRLVFDLNDFDETLPGPFEWDVKRLAASLVVAGRDNGFTAKQSRRIALAAVETYRTAMRGFASQTILDVWYAHLNIEDAVAEYRATLTGRKLKQDKADLKATEKLLAKAHTRDSLQAVGKLTTVTGGRRRIISDPPLIVPIDQVSGLDHEVALGRIRSLVGAYRGTLPPDRRHLLDHFTLADVAHKVVGVGSVGTRAWILLLEGGVEAEALLLQAKQAEASALADYAGASEYANQGERVVVGQRLMQATSDIFLGWIRVQSPQDGQEDYYLRQLRDWKLSAETELMRPESMEVYARLCGWTLARAHARSGDRVAISAYLGGSAKFDNAIADFAETYADQNERDHGALQAAVASGHVQAQSGMLTPEASIRRSLRSRARLSVPFPPHRPGQRWVGRGRVGVAVDDLPVAVLAAVEVGDAQDVRSDRFAVDRHRGVLVADGVGQVPTDAGGDQLEPVGGAVGEPRRQLPEEPAHLVGPALAEGGAVQRDRVLGRPHCQPRLRVAVVDRFLRVHLPGEGRAEEIVQVAHDPSL
jgi:uncharacterized protein (DUF2252 family)